MPLSATDTIPQEPGALRRLARMLWADKFALAAALFKGFPGESGITITVK